MNRLLIALALLLPAAGPEGPVQVAAGASQPHLAATDDGAFHAAFIKDGNIYYSGSADRGKSWSAVSRSGEARRSPFSP